jgi:hypothetical protein
MNIDVVKALKKGDRLYTICSATGCGNRKLYGTVVKEWNSQEQPHDYIGIVADGWEAVQYYRPIDMSYMGKVEVESNG